jgi:hypothetical protein
MTSARHIEANRRNALKSTGPKSENGKQRSRRNAFRHGLTAETVIEVLEDTKDYRGFEAAIIAAYDVRTAVERELVLRLASLLCRIRRATSIETGLLRIQAEILHARRNVCEPVSESARNPEHCMNSAIEGTVASPEGAASTWRELTYCFLRLANLDNGVFDRIGRYEVHLWRQIVQTLFALQTIRHG